MTDPIVPPAHGLGAIQSPADPRDWPIDLLYATLGLSPVAAPPASYRAPAPYPPIFDQGQTGMCVAYSSAAAKAYQDLRDIGLTPDFGLFFAQIGGDPVAGAVPRIALAQMLAHGYPPVGNAADASKHRIAAYYAVPVSKSSIQSAILSFGPVLLSTNWYTSWFYPKAGGILPAPTTFAGGHEIEADGWNDAGLELVNSWGTAWGIGGRCTMPWSYLTAQPWAEVWKSVDVVEPSAKRYTLHIAAHAAVKSYAMTPAGCLTSTQIRRWGSVASTAPCAAPRIVRGCSSGQATVVHVPSGAFAGREVKLGPGVTVTWK